LLTQFLEHFNFGLFQFNIISPLHETQSELIKYVQIFQNGLMLYNIFTLHWRGSHWNILLLCETSSIWWTFNTLKRKSLPSDMHLQCCQLSDHVLELAVIAHQEQWFIQKKQCAYVLHQIHRWAHVHSFMRKVCKQ
jgi:hypothetical protein